MSEAHLRPRSVSEIVDAAFALFRQHAGHYMVAAAIGFAPVVVMQLLIPTPEAMLAQGEDAELGMFFGWIMIASLASLLSYAIIGSLIIVMGSRAYLGQEPDVGAALSTVFPKVPAIIVAAILKSLLYAVGALLLLIGFFYFFARYFAVEASILIENQGPFGALGRSSKLSEGRKWHILLSLALVIIVYWIILMVMAIIGAMITSPIAAVLLSMLVNMIAFPILQLTFVALYYDARIRGEGFDLEHMAASLGSPAPVRT